MTRRAGRTQQPFQQQSLLPQVQSAPVPVTEDLLPGPVAGVASPIISQAAALSLIQNVANAAITTTEVHV